MANYNDRFNKSTTVNASDAKCSNATTVNEGRKYNSQPTTVNQQLERGVNSTTVNQSLVGNDSFKPEAADFSKQTTPNSDLDTTPNLIPMKPTAPDLPDTGGIAEGTVIDEYTLGQPMKNKSGEALLYRCVNSRGEECVLKYYLRAFSDEDLARHKELLSELKKTKKGVVKILASGLYNGRVYEIMPFYSAGSVRDRLERLKKEKGKPPYFTENEIRESILPQMLHIFKSIHDRKIYHADIKPENIMYKSAGSKELVLIDFGVSKKKQRDDNTFTRLGGGTSCYLPPEAEKEGVWEGTDYFALGVILFEMIVGEVPQYISGTSSISGLIPRIDKSIVSDDLDRLLVYLNFGAVMFRNDRTNHFNRWLYDEASKWPNEGWPDLRNQRPTLINVRFKNETYESMDELIFALAGDWERGKNFVARPEGGLVSGLAKSASRDRDLMALSTEVTNYVENATKSGQSEDVILFEFIYQYGHEIAPIFWKGSTFTSLDELGQAVLRSLSSDISEQNPFYELFTERLLEVYMKHRRDLSTAEQVKIMRVCDINFGSNLSYKMYEAAYALIDDKYYYLQNGEYIKTPAGLKAYLAREGNKGNLLGFMNLCREFIDDSGKEKDGFKAWLDANAGASDQTMDVQKEIESLSPIPDDGLNLQFDSRIAEKSKPKGSFWGIPLGIMILAITIVPFSLFIMALNNGTIADANVTMKYIHLIAAIGLPIIPILMARLLCIPRNRVTNTCFGFVSVLCRIMKYDVLATGAALVFDRYSSIPAVNAVTRTIRSGYAWILQNFRNVIGDLGTDRLLGALAQKMNISYPWFNDVVRLIVVFVIYTLIIAIFRRRKVKK